MKTSRHGLSLAARVFILFIAALLFTLPVFAATYPKPQNCIADEAGVLSESTINALETANKTLKLDVGVTIAVCTVKTTEGVDLAKYGRAVYKAWKLGEGVLIVIASEDGDYYIVQSEGIKDIITNDILKEIRDEYLEEDFNSGNIDRGVNKYVTKLKNVLTVGLKEKADAAEAEENASTETDSASSFGSKVAAFFKTLLIILLVIIVLIIAFIIFGLTNDTGAELLGLVYRKIMHIPDRSKLPADYYDERLYGQNHGNARNGNARNGNARNGNNRNGYARNGSNGGQRNLPSAQARLQAPSDRRQNGGYGYNNNGNVRNGNARNGNRNPNGYNVNGGQNYNGNVRNGNARNGGRNPNGYNVNGGQNYNGNRNGYDRAQNTQYGGQNQNNRNYSDGSETRAFSIPQNRNDM